MTPCSLLQRCRGCRGEAWDTVLELEPMPLAGQFCRSEAEARAADVLPLTWVQCRRCALVQVLEDVPDEHLFQQYNYASSSVPGLVRHFDAYAAFLAARYSDRPVRLLEIGCNDGVLLRRLPAPWTRVGVDPSDVARAAPQDGYTLISAPFGAAAAEQVPAAGEYDAVTGSNCLAHIADLADVFAGARRVLRDGGELWIEVHDLDATLSGAQWDTVYHEHKVEWSERSLDACLGAAGFARVHLERLPLHGGLLRAGYRKLPPQRSGSGASPDRGEPFHLLRQAYAGRRSTAAYRAIAGALAAGKPVAAYGASGRANVFLNQLPELRFAYVVDDAPLRQGRWLPRVATPVVPSSHLGESPPDACLITAWNYARDIRAKHPEYRGTWLQAFEG